MHLPPLEQLLLGADVPAPQSGPGGSMRSRTPRRDERMSGRRFGPRLTKGWRAPESLWGKGSASAQAIQATSSGSGRLTSIFTIGQRVGRDASSKGEPFSNWGGARSMAGRAPGTAGLKPIPFPPDPPDNPSPRGPMGSSPVGKNQREQKNSRETDFRCWRKTRPWRSGLGLPRRWRELQLQVWDRVTNLGKVGLGRMRSTDNDASPRRPFEGDIRARIIRELFGATANFGRPPLTDLNGQTVPSPRT